MSTLLVIGGLLGCARPPAQEASGESPLLTSLQVAPSGRDSVHFTLQVTNTSGAPIGLNFVSGQTFDFLVRPVGGGPEVWRWSSEMMFTQALRIETLPPGETQTHRATWVPPASARGEYEVVGLLTASNVDAVQTARFRLE